MLNHATNINSWKWWLGFVLGTLFGSVLLVWMRISLSGSTAALSLPRLATLVLGVTAVQFIFALAAYFIWKGVGTQKSASPAAF